MFSIVTKSRVKLHDVFSKSDKPTKKKLKLGVFTSMLSCFILSVACCAEEVTPTTTAEGGISSLTTIVGQLLNVVTTVFNYIMNNWYLMIFFAAGLVAIGIRIFKSIKKAAKGS